MQTNYWLEMELWKMQQDKLNKLVILASVENLHPRLIYRFTTKIGKMLESVGQYLQTIEQPTYHQTINSSNL